MLEVTPAALKGLNAYQKELSMRGIAPEIVRTRVSFDTDASFPKLQFGFGGFLDADTMTAVDDLFGSDKVKEITGEAQAEKPAALPPPAARPSPVRQAAPAPAPEPEAEEEPAPQPKARGFGAAKPAAAAPAASKPAAPKPVAKPAPAVTAGVDLADEISNMLSGLGADDA